MRDLYIRRMSLPVPLPRESWLNRLPVVRHLAEHGIDFHRQVTVMTGGSYDRLFSELAYPFRR